MAAKPSWCALWEFLRLHLLWLSFCLDTESLISRDVFLLMRSHEHHGLIDFYHFYVSAMSVSFNLMEEGKIINFFLFSGYPECLSGEGKDRTIKAISESTAIDNSDPNSAFEELNDDEICELVKQQSESNYTIKPDLLGADMTSYDDVTLVTQFSVDRLDRFYEIAQLWPGTISASVYVSRSHVLAFLQQWRSLPHLKLRRNILLHMVTQTGPIYPSNALRNIAVKNSVGRFLYLTDVDILPMKGLQSRLRSHLDNSFAKSKKRIQNVDDLVAKTHCWVLTTVIMGVAAKGAAAYVPTFERVHREGRGILPEDKAEVLQQWDAGRIRPFYSTRYQPAYLPILYNKWRRSNAEYKVKYYRQFEPYIVAARDAVHNYSERIPGLYFDKSSHAFVFYLRRFEFFVHPDAFNIHLTHKPTHDNKVDPMYPCVKAIWRNYMDKMEKAHHRQTVKYDNEIASWVDMNA
ncbi:hypothetical protein CAPTEDRAFT_226416 [Capitella teleta]|uniref:Glycosyltransferase family 92 protein n=1 Tax=Capitella teleta TaxID=283909 RepID=R7VJA6_CAPTE|nr:hypothetical protein CAPTEDRAFT_226416 [Capitella teleta]|eukprot:ELU18647.1 hypothetical protein CAPTEDRAFT_226416 [Capitella teleta]